jgi:hypothetical protein
MQTQLTNQQTWESLLKQAKPDIVKALKKATDLNKQIKAQKTISNNKLRKTYKSQSF